MPKSTIMGKALVTLSDTHWDGGDSSLSLNIGWDKGVPEVRVGVNGVDPTTGKVNVTGPFIPLNWEGCNRAIGAIREARDQAFGRPE